MPKIYYNGKKRIVRYTKEDKKLILSLGKRFRTKDHTIDWVSARQTPEFQACWFAKLVTGKRALSHLHYHFTKSYKFKPSEKPFGGGMQSRILTYTIYKEAPNKLKPPPKTVWDKTSWHTLTKLANKYRLTAFINWTKLAQDPLFKTLPVQDIIYLRKYYNFTRRNNTPAMIKQRRKAALAYKRSHKKRYNELQLKRDHAKVVAVNKFLREEAQKQGRFLYIGSSYAKC